MNICKLNENFSSASMLRPEYIDHTLEILETFLTPNGLLVIFQPHLSNDTLATFNEYLTIS